MGKKLSRAEKKAENERAIAEMEDAMREAGTPLGNVGKATPALSKDKTEGAGESRAQKDGGGAAPKTQKRAMHCHKCGTEMKDGVCPKCGYRVYVPMSPEKTKKIRLITGAICIVILILFLVLRDM